MRPISLLRALLFLGLILSLQRASAAQVNWGTTRLATNYTSDLRPLGQGEGFRFEVGAFVDGFEPDAGNVGQWAANWTAAGGAAYNPTFAFAAGSVSDFAGIAAGSRGYIWGFDSREAGAVEWILVTDVAWVWSSSSGPSQPVDWTVANAGEVVLGAVGTGTMAFHMQTAAVLLGTDIQLAAEAWRAQNFAGETDSAIAGWDADADGDGVSNALEFAFGTLPREVASAVRASMAPVQTAGGTVVGIVFDRELRAGVPLVVEVSTDLQSWSPAGEDVWLRAEAGQLVIEDTVPIGAQRRFFRVTVEL